MLTSWMPAGTLTSIYPEARDRCDEALAATGLTMNWFSYEVLGLVAWLLIFEIVGKSSCWFVGSKLG